MKCSILCALAVFAILSGCVSAQEQPIATISSAKPLVVSGRVSQDGKMLLTDIDSAWSVSNREAVKGLEGLLVRVKCFVDTEKNTIKILSARKESSDEKYSAARYSDSAFRR